MKQPTDAQRGELLLAAIASLQAFFPHPLQSSAPDPRMEQRGALTTIMEALSDGEDLSR